MFPSHQRSLAPPARSLPGLSWALAIAFLSGNQPGRRPAATTPLLSGDVTYSPDPLEPPADGEVLISCAQPGTDIVLDM
jgi:hypothetical protein